MRGLRVRSLLMGSLASTCPQIKKMTDRDIARLWSQYVKELAVLLVRAEGSDPPQEVIARMEELVCRELLLLYIRHVLTCFESVSTLYPKP